MSLTWGFVQLERLTVQQVFILLFVSADNTVANEQRLCFYRTILFLNRITEPFNAFNENILQMQQLF